MSRVFVGIVAFVVLLFAVLQIPAVQNKLKDFTVRKLGDFIGLSVEVERIVPLGLKGVGLKGLCVYGARNDTILAADYASVKLGGLDFADSRVALKKIYLSRPLIVIGFDSAGVMNLDPLLRKFSSDDTTSSSARFEVGEIVIRDGSFRYEDLTIPPSQVFGMDYFHLKTDRLFLQSHDFSICQGNYALAIDNLSVREQSGFALKYFHGNATVCDTAIQVTDLSIFTETSKIHANRYAMLYDSFADFRDYCKKVRMEADFTRSTVSFHDISFFASALQDFPYSCSIEGGFAGTVSDFSVTDFHIGYGRSTQFVGDVRMKGLPEIDRTTFEVNAKKLATNYGDIARTRIPPYSSARYVPVPEFLSPVSDYHFAGVAKGTFSDIETHGMLKTNAGSIAADVKISLAKKGSCTGLVLFEDIEVSAFANGSDLFGKASGSVDIESIFAAGSLESANVKGTIDHLALNGYDYSAIQVDGKIASHRFFGKVIADDPNLKLKFFGSADFSRSVPSIRFYSSIEKACLDKLNLFADSLSCISFSTQVDLLGGDLDNLNGTASVRNLQYSNKKGSVSTKNIALTFSNDADKRNATLRSAFVDAEIAGAGNYSDLYHRTLTLLSSHISSIPYETSKRTPEPADFRLSMRIKNIDTVFSLLLPDLKIQSGTTCEATYNNVSDVCSAKIRSPRFAYGAVKMNAVEVDASCSQSSLDVVAQGALQAEKTSTDVVSARCVVERDSILLRSRWNLSSAIRSDGDISVRGKMETRQKGRIPRFVFEIQPSQFRVADSLWNVAKSYVEVDTTSVSIAGFSLFKDAKKILVDGKISQDKADYVVLSVGNYDLKELTPFINNAKVRFAGEINGQVRMKNLYETPLLFADINSGVVSFNDNELGSMRVRSFWNNRKKALLMDASVFRDGSAVLGVEGMYVPSTDSLHCDVSCSDVRLSWFSEFFGGVLDGFSGTVNGDVSVDGSLAALRYKGELAVSDGAFKVGYTNVPYTFSGNLKARKSRFFFSDFTIADAQKNTGEVHGFLDIKTITNPRYVIDILSPKIMAMNTTAKDNDYFYGTIYYNGMAKIAGDLNETEISGVGSTLNNTVCCIPVNYSELSGVYDFLFFADSTTQQGYERIASSSGLTMNLTLNVTPEAQAQIIFDPKVGDIIKARGNGDLQVKMEKDGDLLIFGKYQIEEGDYLFTLKNLINKKLILQKGGTLVWNGDPLNAQVDLSANYETKASPQPLFDSTVSMSKRIPVTCQAQLKNNLLSPDISYDIMVPTSATQVSEVLSTLSDDEKTLQFFSLLLQGSFATLNSDAAGGGSVSLEVLSNQFHNILSQIDPNLDVNLNYHMGTGNAVNNEFEFGISRQFWNDRILVNLNGYTDFGGNNTAETTASATQTTDFSGNASVEMKLNKQGTIKAKGFSRSNDDVISERQGNTNGVGFSFTKDFNTIRDLFRRQKK